MWNYLAYMNYYHGKASLHVYKFDYEMPKSVIQITKIPKTLKEVISYPHKASFFVIFCKVS